MLRKCLTGFLGGLLALIIVATILGTLLGVAILLTTYEPWGGIGFIAVVIFTIGAIIALEMNK